VRGFINPPWTLLPLLPLVVLPEKIGRAAYLVASVAGFGLAAARLGAKPASFAAFLLSPPVLHCLVNGNVDWMPLLGFALPNWLGLLLVFIKPQMGLGIAIYWCVQAWRKGGLKRLVHLLWPVTAAYLVSVIVVGAWPLRWEHNLSEWWNASLWPMSIPVGMALLVAAMRTQRAEWAMAAGPCLSPYVLLHSWSAALIALVSRQAETIAAVIGLWVLVAIRALT
jgi:hypothetical protein